MTNTPPATASGITHKYNAKTLERKIKNKTTLQQKLGWPSEPKRPMLCLPAGMSDELGGELLEQLLPGLLSQPLEILILGKGSTKHGKLFTELANKHNHRIAIVPDTEQDVRSMYAASDMALFLSDSGNMKEVEQCLQFGVVPIAPKCKKLDDYDPVQESGNAFIYNDLTMWQAYAGVVRATETYKFPFDWRTIQKHCMKTTDV